MSDQQQVENDPVASLAPAQTTNPEGLPAAALLVLAANDTLLAGEQAANDTLLAGEQAATDTIAPALSKPDASQADLIAKPASPAGESQPQPTLAENPGIPFAPIDPGKLAGANVQPDAGHDNRPNTQALAPEPLAAAPQIANVSQDNLVQPAARQNQAPEALVKPVNGAAVSSNEGIIVATAPVASNDQAPLDAQIQSSRDVPQVLNDNARPSAPVSIPVPDQLVAKADLSTDEAQLAGQTILTNAKAGNAATSGNSNEAPAALYTPAAKTSADEVPTLTAGSAQKLAETASAPTIDAPKPVKIDREASQAQTTSTAPEQSPPAAGEPKPASLMERLKPLAQAAFSFQGMENAQNSAKTADGLVPAISMTATGDLARPAGITGLAPTSNNPSLPQVPLNNIAVHIAAQASAGNQRFNIRLDPPELGRIDIRLEIGRDGQTLTHLAVEKPETLDLLRQDHRQLERALNNAGLDSRNGSLSFSLRDENQNKQQAGAQQRDGADRPDDKLIEQEGDEPVINRTLNMSSGLDISI